MYLVPATKSKKLFIFGFLSRVLHTGESGNLKEERNKRVEDQLTICATIQAVHAQSGVILLDLSRLELGQVLDGRQTAVLGESQRNGLERVAERSHRVLLERGDLVGRRTYRQRARNLRSAASIHNTIVADQIADHAQSVVQRSLRLLDDHLVAAADEYGDRARILALLDDEHVVLGGAEVDFAHDTRVAQLVSGELAEAGHDATARGYGDELDLGTAHPADGGQLALQQQVIRLVVEAPLTHHKIAARLFHLK